MPDNWGQNDKHARRDFLVGQQMTIFSSVALFSTNVIFFNLVRSSKEIRLSVWRQNYRL